MRKAVTFLQSSHQLSAGAPVTVGIVSDISGEVHYESYSSYSQSLFSDHTRHLNTLIDFLSGKNSTPSRKVPSNVMNAMWQAMRGKSFDALRLRVSEAVAEGYPMSAVLSQLLTDVIYKQGLSNTEKALFCEKIANVSSKP